MTKRIALFAAGAAVAAASFSAPASAAPPCTHQTVSECLRPILERIKDVCVPNGDLEDDCRIGG